MTRAMSDLRASDDDRDAAVAHLRAHHLAGRLEDHEFEERVEGAQRARTLRELAALRTDLPAPEAPPAAEAPRRRPRWPGVREVYELRELDVRALDLYDDVLDRLAPLLARYGYALEEHDGETLRFVYSYRPGWAYVVSVLAFPIGLLALSVRDEDEITVRVTSRGPGRSRLVVYGFAPLGLRRELAGID
jgi:hypothetical protein